MCQSLRIIVLTGCWILTGCIKPALGPWPNLEIPSGLAASRDIPAANELYDRARRLYQDSCPLPAVIDLGKKRQAMLKFYELIQKHPDSSKVGLAAYHIGNAYEYVDPVRRGYLLALQWYERSWQ